MEEARSRSRLLIAAGVLLALCGLVLAVAGLWLVLLGGSWYYVLAGPAFVASGLLLMRGRPAAWWLYAALVAATLAWSLWEVGLDWWGLAARGDVPFVLGLVLLLPPLARRLIGPRHGRRAWPGGRLALAGVLLVYLGVAVASWFVDPFRLEGAMPARAATDAAPPADNLPPGEWHAYGRTGYGQRYSPLDQLTPENVRGLEVAWTYRTGDVRGQPGDPEETTFQVTPLKVGERLYLCTPHQLVIALDATTGRQVWRYEPRIRDQLALQHLTCRGLSYHRRDSGAAPPSAASVATATPDPQPAGWPVAAQEAARTVDDCPEKLFMPTADGRVIALDPQTGGVCTRFGGGTGQINLWEGMPHVRPGAYYSTSPVVVTRQLLIVGGTVLDNVSTREASGVIRGYDIETGALVWAWDPGNPERTTPLAPGETYTANSPNSWSIASVDEELGLVYLPMGNQPPDQWGGARGPATERYSSSIVALEIATGRPRWVFHTVHHDLWDYDVPSQPSLIDLRQGERIVPALVQPTKQGDLYVLDRRTGQPLVPVREVPAPQGAAEGDWTAPTQPASALSFAPPPLTGADMWGATPFDQLACRIAFHRLRYEGRFTPPSERGTLVYPGNFGVFNWGSIAVDPQRQIAFTTPTYLAFTSRLIKRPDEKSLVVQPGNAPQHGILPALNENFGAPYAVELKPFLSVLGIPCQRPPWGYVAGVDLTTGQVVWQHRNGTVRDLAPVPLPLRMGVPNLGGPLLTAAGLAFLSGTLDYYVRAYDVRDGRELWKARLPAGGQATPMTYLGADGRQYLLVVAGGHGSLGTKAGDHVIAYALPPR